MEAGFPHIQRNSARRGLPERVYPGPGEWCMTEGGLRRYDHLDLEAMSFEERDWERRRLALRLLLDADPDPWLLQRRTRLGDGRRGARR